MTKIIKIIGSAVFTAVMYAVPVMIACAFCLNWDGFYKLCLLIMGAGQYIVLTSIVYEKADMED